MEILQTKILSSAFWRLKAQAAAQRRNMFFSGELERVFCSAQHNGCRFFFNCLGRGELLSAYKSKAGIKLRNKMYDKV